MKQWLKKITGIEAREQEIATQLALQEAAFEAESKRLKEEELKLLKKKDPKAYATKKGQPWINVLDVKVNEDNVRNGFFELDWNDLFIEQLRLAGYGEEMDLEEEIVDRWFRDIVYNMLADEEMDTDRGAGYINVVPIDKGRSEVS